MVGGDHVPGAVQDQRLIVVGGVVGADHHHPPHAFLARRLEHVVGHRHVGQLGAEPRFALHGDRCADAVRGTGGGAVRGAGLAGIGRAHEGAVHHRIGAGEVGAVGVAIVVRQIRRHQASHRTARAIFAAHVQQGQVVARAQTRQHQAGDVPGRSGQDYPHGYGTTTTRPSMRPACSSANTSFTSASGRRAIGGGSMRPSRRSSISSARSCGVPRWEPRMASSP